MTIPYPVGHALRGQTNKDKSDYLKALQEETTDPSHPRNRGVTMQAHHLISAKAVSMGKFNDRLEDFGYEINVVKNLVFIPSTLQGACLLRVQPHRGNHTARDAPDIDGNREPSYHEKILAELRTLMPRLERECGKPGVNMKSFTHEKLDGLSRIVANRIQNKPSEAKLTKLFENFQPNNPKGCGGAKASVNDPSKPKCPIGRNHTGKSAPGQDDEGITYSCSCANPYKLEPGK